MLNLFRAIIARVKALLATSAALELEATDYDGRGAFRCRQSEAFQRVGAVNWLTLSAVRAVTGLPLPKTPKAAILASHPTRIGGVSVDCDGWA